MNKASSVKSHDEAHAFTELTKNLLSVPKKEIDERRDRYEKTKKRESVKQSK